jgi:sensor histidine kinase YesM
MPKFSISGLLVLLCAVVLTNVNHQRLPRPVILGIGVFTGCALALQLNSWLWIQDPMSLGYWIHKLRIVVLHWGLVTAAYYFIESSAQRAAELREAELERHRIEAQMLEARLQVMQAQVEPHFLFNTLASISSLIRTQPETARMLIVKLSSLLRRLLKSQDHFTTLRDELASIDEYLGIESVRFGPSLRILKQIDETTLDTIVPSMILQPLIENSIKHGVSPKVGGGTVTIRSRQAPGVTVIEVADDGMGMTDEALSNALYGGVGLSNVNERLKVIYGSTCGLTLRSAVGGGTCATMEIPETVRPSRLA